MKSATAGKAATMPLARRRIPEITHPAPKPTLVGMMSLFVASKITPDRNTKTPDATNEPTATKLSNPANFWSFLIFKAGKTTPATKINKAARRRIQAINADHARA